MDCKFALWIWCLWVVLVEDGVVELELARYYGSAWVMFVVLERANAVAGSWLPRRFWARRLLLGVHRHRNSGTRAEVFWDEVVGNEDM